MTAANRIAALEAENAMLREALSVAAMDGQMSRLSLGGGAEPRLSALAYTFFKSGDPPMPAADPTLDVALCRIRKKMGCDPVITVWIGSAGAVLSPACRQRVAELLGVPP